MNKTLGGDRLGSGKKMQVDLHGFGRSTHNLSYVWRNTQSVGTLVPFMSLIGLPGDTFDIRLDSKCLTNPTVGPAFANAKLQYDIFVCPIRLYQGKLHNNELNIGLKMDTVKLPIFGLKTPNLPISEWTNLPDLDNSQINPSSILAYLGLRGIGITDESNKERTFNGTSWIAYWDIVKNYYANKQEEIGAVIHTPPAVIVNTINTIEVDGQPISQYPVVTQRVLNENSEIVIDNTGTLQPIDQIFITTNSGTLRLSDIVTLVNISGTTQAYAYNWQKFGTRTIWYWKYATTRDLPAGDIQVQTFPLSDIDAMRKAILLAADQTLPFKINDSAGAPDTPLKPWEFVLMNNTDPDDWQAYQKSQEGLALKTYQSDMFNAWLNTEWLDGSGGINEITSIDTSSGEFTIDTLILANKVYKMLNRIAVSGGSYNDWLDAQYATERHRLAESPIYVGGMSKELMFQEVVSNSESSPGGTGSQPLGTLAGRGVLSNKHKGGYIVAHIEEPSYIIGICSITPRIDYSQGNSWDLNLKTYADFHVPSLDEIGFQDMIQEDMAWWTTFWNGTGWEQQSAGKQPAWLKYMTAVNKCYGNFAIQDNEMFMTWQRKYRNSADGTRLIIDDMTTYIDPVKFNYIFAQTSLDSMNYWMQIAVDIEARRVMSAKVMPNL